MAEKKNITRAQALTNGIAYANANGDKDTAEVLTNMLAQVTKPRKAAVSKARLTNENLAKKVAELVGDEVTTKDVVALGLPEITTTQKAAAVLRVACELGKFEKVTDKKKVTYKKVIAEQSQDLSKSLKGLKLNSFMFLTRVLANGRTGELILKVKKVNQS